jgi:hypothetical protein
MRWFSQRRIIASGWIGEGIFIAEWEKADEWVLAFVSCRKTPLQSLIGVQHWRIHLPQMLTYWKKFPHSGFPSRVMYRLRCLFLSFSTWNRVVVDEVMYCLLSFEYTLLCLGLLSTTDCSKRLNRSKWRYGFFVNFWPSQLRSSKVLRKIIISIVTFSVIITSYSILQLQYIPGHEPAEQKQNAFARWDCNMAGDYEWITFTSMSSVFILAISLIEREPIT